MGLQSIVKAENIGDGTTLVERAMGIAALYCSPIHSLNGFFLTKLEVEGFWENNAIKQRKFPMMGTQENPRQGAFYSKLSSKKEGKRLARGLESSQVESTAYPVQERHTTESACQSGN